MTSFASSGPLPSACAFREAPAPVDVARSGLGLRLWRPSSTAVVVHVAGELDASRAPRLHELLAPQWTFPVEALVLDLSELGFLGVAGLQLLAHARKRAALQGMTVCVVDGPVCVDRALRAAGWADMVPTYPTVAAAVAEPGGQAREDTPRVAG